MRSFSSVLRSACRALAANALRCSRQRFQCFVRAEGPADAVRADRPAAAAAGVLHDLVAVADGMQAGRDAVAIAGQLEFQRIARALRVQHAESQRGGVGQVAGPHVVPQLARFKALAGMALPPL
jgi:hypothetical protein